MNRHIQHLRSSDYGKAPSATFMDYGELALNFNSESLALYTKNNTNNIVNLLNEGRIGGDYVITNYPSEFKPTSAISINDKYDVAFKKVENTVASLANNVIENEEVTSKALFRLNTSAGFDLNGYFKPSNNNSFSATTSIKEALEVLDEKLDVVAETAGKVNDVKINNVSVVTEKVANIPLVTHSNDGVLTKEDKIKLDNINIISSENQDFTYNDRSNANMLLVQNNKNLKGKTIIKFGWRVDNNSNIPSGEYYLAAMTNNNVIIAYSNEKLTISSYANSVIYFTFDGFVFPIDKGVWGFALISKAEREKVVDNTYQQITKNFPNMRPSISTTVTESNNKCMIVTDGIWKTTWQAAYYIKYYENNIIDVKVGGVSVVNDNVADIPNATQETSGVMSKEDKIKLDNLYKTPNLTIIGTPSFVEGYLSDFDSSNYAQFPFLVDLRGKNYEIGVCFATSMDVTIQQNIFDSDYGLAFAIRNGRLVIAKSTDGSSWVNEYSGNTAINARTTYYIKIKNDGVYISTDNVNFVKDITADLNNPYPKVIFIGKSVDNSYPFKGTINLNHCYVLINDEDFWRGMDEVGLATRLAIDMSNIDAGGVQKVKDIMRPIIEENEEIVATALNQLNDSAGFNEYGEFIPSNESSFSEETTIKGALEVLDNKIDSIGEIVTNNDLGNLARAVINVERDDNRIKVTKPNDNITYIDLNMVGYGQNSYNSSSPYANSAVTSGNTVFTAVDKVEKVVVDLVEQVIKNERTVSTTLSKITEASGVLGADGELAYQKNTSAHYINNAESLADADDKLDAAIDALNTRVNGINPGSSYINYTERNENGNTSSNIETIFTDGNTEYHNLIQIGEINGGYSRGLVKYVGQQGSKVHDLFWDIDGGVNERHICNGVTNTLACNSNGIVFTALKQFSSSVFSLNSTGAYVKTGSSTDTLPPTDGDLVLTKKDLANLFTYDSSTQTLTINNIF